MSRFDRTEAHVRETVRRLGDADCDTVHETLIGTAFELAEPRRRAGMIGELLEDGERLLRLAERSSQHPNGFSKLVLMGDEYDTFKVRLHLWWPDSVGPGGDDDTRNEVEHVHNHRPPGSVRISEPSAGIERAGEADARAWAVVARGGSGGGVSRGADRPAR
jgi:hypothetical protein